MRGDPCIDCNRIAAGIQKRATALAKAKLEGSTTQPAAPVAAEKSTAADEEGRLTLDLDPEVCAELARQPLPEAPASVNCHIMMEGRQVQVTLRDTDETRLLTRLATLLRQYPIAQPPPPPPQNTAPPAYDDSPYCHLHKAVLQKFTKDGRTWYSHKTADGSWCKGQ